MLITVSLSRYRKKVPFIDVSMIIVMLHFYIILLRKPLFFSLDGEKSLKDTY